MIPLPDAGNGPDAVQPVHIRIVPDLIAAGTPIPAIDTVWPTSGRGHSPMNWRRIRRTRPGPDGNAERWPGA